MLGEEDSSSGNEESSFATFYLSFSKYMYLRATHTKYKMATTKLSIWKHVIYVICTKNGPFLASRVADTIYTPHRRSPLQQENQRRDSMNKNKDCRVGQLTNAGWAAHFHDMIKIIKRKSALNLPLCSARLIVPILKK